jgi:hypothetical protein
VKIKNVDLIIYHRDCPDGFCAAFVAKKKFPHAELLGAAYGEPLPDVAGRVVLVVDFSWKRAECEMLYLEAGGFGRDPDGFLPPHDAFHILDHHQTAEAELAGLDFATFDLNRSGATLTCDTLFPGEPRPWYVDYVEDRDLWRWALPDSREVSGFTMALPHTVAAWNLLDTLSFEQAVEAGKGIRLHIDHYVEKVSAQFQLGRIGARTVAIVNAAYPNISDVGNELCKHADIGAGWFERGDGLVQFSLRSVGELDVSAIARSYGGGGHRNAAGFQLERRAGMKVLDDILGR